MNNLPLQPGDKVLRVNLSGPRSAEYAPINFVGTVDLAYMSPFGRTITLDGVIDSDRGVGFPFKASDFERVNPERPANPYMERPYIEAVDIEHGAWETNDIEERAFDLLAVVRQRRIEGRS